MAGIPELSEVLVGLGLPKPEADAYVQLYLLSSEGPATGYQVAKALGKDPTSVYKALEELRKKGYLETVAGRGKQFRPEDPEQLIQRLERDVRARAAGARRLFSETPPPVPQQEVYQLATADQTLDRFRRLLDEARHVALLDLAPGALSEVADSIRQALARGVEVVVKLYAEPNRFQTAALAGAVCIVEPDGELMTELMPGPVLHGVFDCRAQLVAYLDGFRDREITQAFWTPNLFLAYQAHSGLASEIIHTALRLGLARGDGPEALQAANDDLAARVHGPVDWEAFWRDTGFGDPERRRRRRAGSRLPWRQSTLLVAEGETGLIPEQPEPPADQEGQ